MRWTVIPLALVALLAGCTHPAAPPALPRQTAGETIVTLASGSSAHTGDNTLGVTLANAATGATVGNANITATPEMLSPHMTGPSTTGRAQGNGFYTIPVRLGVASKYRITLKIERPGKMPAEAAFTIEASQ